LQVSLAEVPNVELGIGGGKILAPVAVPYVKVESDFYTGPTRWAGVGVRRPLRPFVRPF
jgi:hypothetical protein